MARWRDPIDTGGIAAGTPFYFTAIPPLRRTPGTRGSFEHLFLLAASSILFATFHFTFSQSSPLLLGIRRQVLTSFQVRKKRRQIKRWEIFRFDFSEIRNEEELIMKLSNNDNPTDSNMSKDVSKNKRAIYSIIH